MRWTVFDEPEHPSRRVIRLAGHDLAGHDLADEPFGWLDPGMGLAAPEQPGSVDVPCGKVVERPGPLVLDQDQPRRLRR